MTDTLGKFMKFSDRMIDVIQPAPVLRQPAPIGKIEAPPSLRSPTPDGPIEFAPPLRAITQTGSIELAPPLSAPSVVAFEQAPVLSSPSSTGSIEQPPALRVTSTLAFEQAPILSVTATLPLQQIPVLSSTSSIAFEQAPVLSVNGTGPAGSADGAINTQLASSRIDLGNGNIFTLQSPNEGNTAYSNLSHESSPLNSKTVLGVSHAQMQESSMAINLGGGSQFTMLRPDDGSTAYSDLTNAGKSVLDIVATASDHKFGSIITSASLVAKLPQSDHSDVIQATDFSSLGGIASSLKNSALSTQASMNIAGVNLGANLGKIVSGDAGGVTINGKSALLNLKSAGEAAGIAAETYAKSALQSAVNAGANYVQKQALNLINSLAGNVVGGVSTYTPTNIPHFSVQSNDPVFSYSQNAHNALEGAQASAAHDNDVAMNRLNAYGDTNFSTEVGAVEYGPNIRAFGQYTPPTNALINAFASNLSSNPTFKSNKKYIPPTEDFAKASIPSLGVDQRNGFLTVQPDDDATYVPLVFTDLRIPGQNGGNRSVYLQPYITGLSETITPQWAMQNYFGRTDPVATYQSTGRTISLSFKLVCFDASDLSTIYKKLGWLTSMCYPQYKDNEYFSGPVIRMRVGDLISSRSTGGKDKGLSGFLTNLTMNYEKSTWEIQKDAKIPREIDVSLGFQVLHDLPIGLVEQSGPGIKYPLFGGISGTNISTTSFRAPFGDSNYLSNGTAGSANLSVPNITLQAPGAQKPTIIGGIISGVASIINGASPSQITQAFGAPNPDAISGIGK